MPMCVYASVCASVQWGGPLCNLYCVVSLEPPTDSFSSHEHHFPTSYLEIIARHKTKSQKECVPGAGSHPNRSFTICLFFILSLCLTQTYAHADIYHTSTHILTHIHMVTYMQVPLFLNYLGVSFPSHRAFPYTTVVWLQTSVTNIDKVIYLIYHFCSKFTRWLTVCKSTSLQHASESQVVHWITLSLQLLGVFGNGCSQASLVLGTPFWSYSHRLLLSVWSQDFDVSLRIDSVTHSVSLVCVPLRDDIRGDSTPLAADVSIGYLIKVILNFLKSALHLINNGMAFQRQANILIFIYSLLYLAFTDSYSWYELG